MQKRPARIIASWLDPDRLTQMAMAQGSRHTGMIADMARPTGAFVAGSKLVTMPTGAGMCRSTREPAVYGRGHVGCHRLPA
jgi:hypothetical protein